MAAGTVIKHLNVQQATDYIAEVTKNSTVFHMIRESFKLKYDEIKGITKDEMDEVIDGMADADLQRALKGVKLLGDGRSILAVDNMERNKYRKSLVIYGKRNDGKFNVLVVHATQVKELDVGKLVACGLGAACAGVLAGCLTMNPVVGVSTAALLSAASGVKSAHDYTQQMPDVLCGYILEELVQKNILKIKPNSDVQFAIE
ncbi:unnamed protein product [Rotaria sp. Silwood1]|nr:unnamed protein product [Rotaria sp. Silwood1]